MSKKTKNIYSEIENLELLQKKINAISEENNIRELKDIEFEMQQGLKSLRFWIDSLYSYNGKSTSNAKKTSSKENGKKGGRPPKIITASRRRIEEITEILLPELNHEIKMTDDFEKENQLKTEILKLQSELEECNKIIENWNNSKNK